MEKWGPKNDRSMREPAISEPNHTILGISP